MLRIKEWLAALVRGSRPPPDPEDEVERSFLTRIGEWFEERIFGPLVDLMRRWWREASGPMVWDDFEPAWRTILQRVLLWLPAVALLVALFVGVMLYFYIGWRASDLTGKALENARLGNLPMAWLQVRAAEGLRPGRPDIRHAKAFVQSRMGNGAALLQWEELAAGGELRSDEVEEWARLAALAGNDRQFEKAIAAVERSGDASAAAGFRATRLLRRGDLASSAEQARLAAASGDPAWRMNLLRALLLRYGSSLKKRGGASPGSASALREIIGLVDAMRGTPQENQAIAMVLGAISLPMENARSWASAALEDLSPDNPALLSSVEILIKDRQGTPRDFFKKLSPVFENAPLESQVHFAQWLNRHDMRDEILQMITPEEAGRSNAAFQARGRALAGEGRWQELLDMTGSSSRIFESLRMVFRAIALKNLGKANLSKKAWSDAIYSAARENTMAPTLEAADASGESALADSILIKLCADPIMTDTMFRLARGRFANRGRLASLSEAWTAAMAAAPELPVVLDYGRRIDLIEGRSVSLDETSAAMAAAPADVQMRFTHALNLLKAGRAADALGVFHDMDVIASELPPGDKAVAIAILESNGMSGQAKILRRSLDPGLLRKGEFALILPQSEKVK